jgi:hypothetical protein
VLAFDHRAEDSDTVDFIVCDPNDPAAPRVVRFDPRAEPARKRTALDPALPRVLGRRAP